MHLALIGYGNIGRETANLLSSRPVEKLTVLVRSSAVVPVLQDPALRTAATSVEVTDDLETLVTAAPDLTIECAGQEAVARYAPALLTAARTVLIVSTGALADQNLSDRLRAAAEDGGGRLILPSGAIGGIDLLSALTLSGNMELQYIATKPPAAWRDTSAEEVCDLSALQEPCAFFRGNARTAAQRYPKNANVAATLALAGPGFESTQVTLVADPNASGNMHAYEVDCPAGRFSMQIENAPSAGNAKTSLATVYSVLREINRLRDRVTI
ncbi:aspartate dehydrogenase [uncultured Roseobacter sp.]|uniref:aspartate dehydrogenase n=1 Tax=uncultured Roseobacter sp. TaxID=114847 RepID=UPI00263773B0|nr:aspartate dehydrogenase [uncultured Roseobacter sp.]